MRRFGLSVAVPVAAVPVVAGHATGAVPGVDLYVVERDDAFFVTSSAMNSCIVYGLENKLGMAFCSQTVVVLCFFWVKI